MQNKIRVIVNGAKGKMGLQACDVISKHPDFDLVAELGHSDNLSLAIHQNKAQIVVDLTRADCVMQNSLCIIENGASPVIGTSGLQDKDIQQLRELCAKKELGGIIVPNFSIAAVLMMHFAAITARYMPEVEIIEAHHQQKLDAPSGTAIKTAELIQQERQQEKNSLELKELVPGARGAEYAKVHIHSIRLPGIIARQEVLFGSLGETLSITHNSIDRASFMPGLILACQKVRDLKGLEYGLESLLADL